jgi:predicted nucleotidyltransferase
VKPIPGIREADQRAMEAILAPLAEARSFHLFGSRAFLDHRNYSDIDILVEGDCPVPTGLLAQVESGFEEPDLPVEPSGSDPAPGRSLSR